MIDINGATQSMTKLATNTTLTSMGVVTTNIASKASWNMQVKGEFALLFPDIHILFPTREEVSKYLTQAFATHHGSNLHKSGPEFTMVQPIIDALPKETVIVKKSRPIPVPVTNPTSALGDDMPEVETGVPQVESMTVFAASPAIAFLTT